MQYTQYDIIKSLNLNTSRLGCSSSYDYKNDKLIRVSNHRPVYSNLIENLEFHKNINKIVLVFNTGIHFKMSDSDLENYAEELSDDLTEDLERDIIVECYLVDEDGSREDFEMSVGYIKSMIKR